jgi:hypothetical protein
MSEMPHKAQFEEPTQLHEHPDFRLLRNEYLDLLADLETELFRVGKKAQCSLSETASLHQRLESLGKAKPSPQLSTSNATKLKEMVAGIDGHLRIRNSIVHSVMTVGSNGASDAAIFQNATDRSAGHPFFLILTVRDFSDYFALIRGFIRVCKQIITPPSSQLQPSQAATAGP